MANEMTCLTDEILKQALEQHKQKEFDTHDLISTLMTGFSREYVRQLYGYLDHPKDPFVGLHTRIGRRLASEEFHDTLKQLHRKRRSRNCRGKDDDCEMWAKV